MGETRSVEASGADIEEAIEAGLAILQVARENVIVEILEEPSRGLLGIGARQATIRLTTAARYNPPAEPTINDTRQTDEFIEDDDEPLHFASIRGELVPESQWPPEVKLGKEQLETLIGMMGIQAEVTVEQTENTDEDEEETFILQVRGANINNLIGRKGETLAALQYLSRLVASRGMQRRANFVVDVGDYKANRADKLFQLANRMANQAVERRRTVKLEPMPPHERRIIHMALRSRADVSTSSVGEGRFRKVTIIPKLGG